MRLARLTLTLLVALPLGAQQQPRQLTAEDYARAEKFLGAATNPLVSGAVIGRPMWHPDGRLVYRASAPDGAKSWVVDPATGKKSPAAAADLQAARTGGRAAPANVPDDASVNPQGTWAVYIKDYNLWARDLATGKDVQLTTDGIKDFGYATDNAGWVHSDRPVVTWGPDGKSVATFQHDGRGVRDMYLVSTNVGAPKLEAWKYPMPGDTAVFHISRVVISWAGGAPSVVRLKMAPDFHRSTVSDHVLCGDGICDLQWYPDGSKLAFVSVSRDHKRAWMRVADARTGDVRTLFEESMPTQVGDASLNEHLWKVLPASNELVWWSQKENWTHLYLYDLATGKLKNRITSGEGNVDEIVRVDEAARQVYFLGLGKEAGRDPYFAHLYRIGFDGKKQQLLTPENGNHAVAFSPNGKYFVDTYSTPDTPPATVLRTADGKLVASLEKADISRLVASGWRAPVPITVKARDGKTDLYGLMYLPTTLDSTKKYPIINHIYPGPQVGSVGPRSFFPSRGDDQALAELGFVVVEIDGMGTPGRSKAFADAYYGRMNDNTIPDQVAGMRDLAQRYKFIDLDRVGIWGHSGGGFATAAAMFNFPDFFEVGISESGNHDNRNYEDDWGERYQGLLVKSGPSDNYADEANQSHAKNLKGKLFLLHGAMDDNVPPQNTMLVADALMKAGKDFDMLMLPQARHGYGQYSQYVMRRRWDYFVKNLQGNEPPKMPAMVP